MSNKKHEYTYTIITFKGLVIHNTCRDVKPLIASKEKTARQILKCRYPLCNITNIGTIGDSSYMFKGY